MLLFCHHFHTADNVQQKVLKCTCYLPLFLSVTRMVKSWKPAPRHYCPLCNLTECCYPVVVHVCLSTYNYYCNASVLYHEHQIITSFIHLYIILCGCVGARERETEKLLFVTRSLPLILANKDGVRQVENDRHEIIVTSHPLILFCTIFIPEMCS